MKKVTIYIADTCPRCKEAKEYFENKSIEFIEKNVQKSKKAKDELLSMGHRIIPTIVIGENEIVGFDKNKLDKLLK